MPVENAYCFACGRTQLQKNEIGLNKKLINKAVKQFYCLDCLADYLEVGVDELLAKVKEFKEQGCELF